MTDDQQRMIELIKERLRVLDPEKIILFGSRAQGTSNFDSDLDLIVVLNKEFSSGSFKERMHDTVAVRKLLADINRQVALDLLVYSKQEWQALLDSHSSFSRELVAKGITIQ